MINLLPFVYIIIEQVQIKRTYIEGLKAGFPNLLVAQPGMCKITSKTCSV